MVSYLGWKVLPFASEYRKHCVVVMKNLNDMEWDGCANAVSRWRVEVKAVVVFFSLPHSTIRASLRRAAERRR